MGQPSMETLTFPFVCVMKVVLTVKTAGRKNYGALSARGFYEIRGSVSRIVTGMSDWWQVT